MPSATTRNSTDLEDSPIMWFYRMEDSRNRYDFEGALRAKKELERLGYFFTYRPGRPSSKEGPRAG